MATFASISSLHRDIRSESRGFKRDKQHSTKWAHGTRPGAGVKIDRFNDEALPGTAGQITKVRPEKKFSDQYSAYKCHANSYKNHQMGDAAARMSRKAEARAEVDSPSSLSRSLAELAPHASPTKHSRNPSTDSGILYSFDAKASPRRGVGLDSLVEKAEREWMNKETAKLVRDEYEILDQSGEITVVKEGKKGKRGSPKSNPQLVMEADDEDWERL